MFSKKFIFLVIIGISLGIGAITFLIYKALFHNETLSLIVAIATAIFICIMAQLTLLNLAVSILARQRERTPRFNWRRVRWPNRPSRPQTKIVDSTIASVLNAIEEQYCPRCGSKALVKRRMSIKREPGYRCEKCRWKGQEAQLSKRRKPKKAPEVEPAMETRAAILEDEQKRTH